MTMILTAMIFALAAPASAPTPIPRRSLERPGSVKTHPVTWVTMGDYPISARREKREGSVEFKVRYGADGWPVGCEIVSSSGHDDLDAMTCQLVQARARFGPGKMLKARRWAALIGTR
ncbi:energy transducer TonB [Sphingopyxis sp. Root154]